jgi:UDP-N-acetylmuramate-alanine ligase
MKINIASNEVIHFIGIGGIGMSGLAQIMKNMGFSIQGSDLSQNKPIGVLSDIAPTVLSLLECREVPVFDGRPLKEVFDMDVRSVNREGEDAAVYKREQMSEEQEEEIKKKLRSLGYL